MLGAVIGDIAGSIHEGGSRPSKDFPFFGPGFAAWVRKGGLAPSGSFGHGAATRVSPAAPLARSCVAPNVSSKRRSCDTFS